MRVFLGLTPLSLSLLLATGLSAPRAQAQTADQPPPPDPSSVKQKLMCGYQGWFRCPNDPSDLGWIHWSRNSRAISPQTLSVEMWPDMTEYGESERFPAPGFSYPDGRPAHLFSSDNPDTVLRHFTWMRDHGIDGAYLQQFVVNLPGAPGQRLAPSHRRILNHVRDSARQTGRVWAVTYDISGTPADLVFDVLTRDWKSLVDSGVTADPQYLHESGKPVVMIWGFYRNSPGHPMTPELANRLLDLFHGDGPLAAYVIGGGDWNWRRNFTPPAWRQVFARLDAYLPWNVGNYRKDPDGVVHASTAHWADDRRQCEALGVSWLPVVYPGFGWDNLKHQPPGTSTLPRRQGAFFWEQFVELARLHVDTAYIAMFDEVDEGTAIFKVTNAPPAQAHFLDYEGMPPDWYLRLSGEAGRMIRGQRPLSVEIPIRP